MSIDWVPLVNVPMHRRLELLGAALHILILLFGHTVCLAIFAGLLVRNHIFSSTSISSSNANKLQLQRCILMMNEKNKIDIAVDTSDTNYYFQSFLTAVIWQRNRSNGVLGVCWIHILRSTRWRHWRPWCRVMHYSSFSLSPSLSHFTCMLCARERGCLMYECECNSYRLLVFFSSGLVRNWFMWKYFVNYFPVDLVKTVDLPADQHYLFAVFPHGVIGWERRNEISILPV